MWRYYQPNPHGRAVGDCTVRALTKALGVGWYTAYDELTDAGRKLCDMPSSDHVWSAVLRDHGFSRAAVSNSCPDCYTAADFCEEHPSGTFVLAFGGHVATVKDGTLYDAFDSSQGVPQYYFYRR